MKINGVVSGGNREIGRWAIRTDHGFAVVDLIDGELQFHDAVTGDLESPGPVVLINRTTAEPVEVCVEAIHATLEGARALLRNR
jgi:hypothetical protein